MKSIILAIFTIGSLNTFADFNQKMVKGDWGSGGGNSVVCFKKKAIANKVKANNFIIEDEDLNDIRSIEIYDLYEAKLRGGLSQAKPEIIKIKEEEYFYDYFQRLGSRYKKYVYPMTGLIEQGVRMIPESHLLFHDSPVLHQDDLGSVVLPSQNCLIITVAAQVNLNDYYDVHIDARLFNHPKHSRQSQATLILHEMIYAQGREFFEHKNSGPTRKIVKNFITFHESITDGQVSEDLNKLNFRIQGVADYREINSRAFRNVISANIFDAFYFSWYRLVENSISYFNSFIWESEKARIFTEMIEVELKNEGLSITNELGFGDEWKYTFLYNFIVILNGIRDSNDTEKWLNFMKEYEAILQNCEQYLRGKFLTNGLDQVYQSIKKNSKPNQEQLNNLKNFSEIAVGYLFNEMWNKTYSGGLTLSIMNFYEEFKNKPNSNRFITYVGDIAYAEGCITTPSGDTTCFTPLNLNNIIPKK